MQWKPYTGNPFEGERIFKKLDQVELRTDYNGLILKTWDKYKLYYRVTDESESFTKEDMREIHEDGYYQGYEDGGFKDGCNPKKSFDEWLKQREGK